MELREVAPLVDDALPVAAAWEHEISRGRSVTRWELEWARPSVDQEAIEARLDSLGYTLSDQAGSSCDQKGCSMTFHVKYNGDLEPKCGGSATQCSSFDGQSSCESQDGCYWK